MKRLFNFIVILVALFCWICCENLVEEEGPIEYSKPSSVEVSASNSRESLDIILTAKPNGQSVKSVASASFVYSLSEDLSNPTTVSAVASGDAFTATFKSLEYGKRLYYQATIVSAFGSQMTSSVGNITIPSFSEFVKVSAPELVEATSSTITLKSDYQSVEGIAIAERGFCWSTELAVPSIENSRVIAASAFQCAIEGLEQMQTINARAYVKDTSGIIAYSEVEQFITDAVHVSEVSLNKTELQLNEGEAQTLVTTVKPDDAANKTVSWTSSDTGVATVDANGKVTAVKAGKATITVTSEDGGKTAACEVTVKALVGGIELNKTSLTLNEGASETLIATVKPENASNKNVGWKSSDTSVATVDANGKVTAVKAGTATITVTTEDGGKTATCKVIVSAQVVEEYVDLGLSVKWATCNLGASKPEEHGLYYQWGDIRGYSSNTSDGKYFYWGTYKWCNGSDKTLTKYSTMSSYGPVVDNANVLDLEDDAAHVTLGGKWRMPTYAEWAELRENCIWTWTTVNGINGYIVTSEKSGYITKSIFLSAAGYRYGDDLYNVGSVGDYWSSSLYTAIPNYALEVTFNSGSAGRNINFRYFGYSIRPVYDEATVQVTSLSLNKTSLSLSEGGSETLTATISPSNATNKSVSWKSSNTSVATVDAGGKVTAVKAGSATISVTTVDGSKTASCAVTVAAHAIEEYVDLGLSVKWATCNLGASQPEEYGLYYQWGETQGYGSDFSVGKYFYWSGKGEVSYKWCNGSGNTLTKYNTKSSYGPVVDSKTVLDPEDDAAHVTLGGKWRMPTDAEWTELRENCTWTWATVNGIDGYIVAGKKSGYTEKSIFLPAAGYRYEDYFRFYVGDDGFYWSSSLSIDSPDNAYGVNFFWYSVDRYSDDRCHGQSIRPVLE